MVFRAGATIELDRFVKIRKPFITIAGQTAPGAGIAVKGGKIDIETHDVVMRYVRVRLGRALGSLSIEIGNLDGDADFKVALDHVSATWGSDEILSAVSGARDVTVQ